MGTDVAFTIYDCPQIRFHIREVCLTNQGAVSCHSRPIPYSYRLVPMGSFSRVEKTAGDKATYELYGSGDLHFGRLLHNRRFDIAMVAVLDCLKQIMDWVKSQDASVEFPHQ